MKKKLLVALFGLVHLAFFMFIVNCKSCCGECLCCIDGSPVTSSDDRSYCDNGSCPAPGSFQYVDEDKGSDCAAACATLIGEDFGRRGCMDEDAANHDATATKSDPSLCTYAGCTDKCADNYSIKATSNDGSCSYSPKCMDPKARNYSSSFQNCNGKVQSDISKCTYNSDPDPQNNDLIPAIIKEVDYCVTYGTGDKIANGSEVTFRAIYSYSGSRKLHVKMLRDGLICGTDCDDPRSLQAGQDMQAFAQGIVNHSNGNEMAYDVRIVTEDPLRKPNQAEIHATKAVRFKLADPIKPCETMTSGKHKPIGDALAPKAPNVVRVTHASGKLNVTVKHDVRDSKVNPATVKSVTERAPDYYVIAFDAYSNRSQYTQDGKLNSDAWYKALVENGLGTVRVVRPAKIHGEEETWALDAAAGTYAVFVKAVNGVWPFGTPPSTTAKVLAAEGSPLVFKTFPENPGKVTFQSKDRMLYAAVTIPAGISSAGFSLKSNTQDYGTYDGLLASSGSRSFHIYDSEADIFSDAEFAAGHPAAYYGQKVLIVKDGSDPRKFHVYAVFGTLGPVTLNLTLDGAADPAYVHTLAPDPTFGFSEWIEFANTVIGIDPAAPVVTALAKRAAVEFQYPGLMVKVLLEVFKVQSRREIAWIKGFYQGVVQGFVSDAEGLVGLALFFKEAVTNGSNLYHLIKQEINNFHLSEMPSKLFTLFENVSNHVISEADKAILYPDLDEISQVKAFMHGYVFGFAMEQYAIGVVALQGYSFVGRGLAYSVQLTRAGPVVMSTLAAVKKWRVSVVAAALQPLRSATTIAAEKIRQIHGMVDRLVTEIVQNTPDTYGKKLAEYFDHADKTQSVDRATGGNWTIAHTVQRRLVDLNEKLLSDGSAKLSEKGAEGFMRLHKHVLALDGEGVRFFEDFIDAFLGTDGKLKRDILNADLEEYVKFEIEDPDFIARVRLPPNIQDEFRDGGAFLMTRDQYDFHVAGKPRIGRPDGQFMVSKEVLDELLDETGGDVALLEQRLGTTGWVGKQIVRIDVPRPLDLNARFPTENLSGANSQFIFGGKTSGGLQEIVTDPIPSGQFTHTFL